MRVKELREAAAKFWTRDGEQFELFSAEVMRDLMVPWGGLSPRRLTSVERTLFLRQEPQKSMSEPVLTLFPMDEPS